MSIFESKHVHFVGIGGIGVSAMARYFLHLGSDVSGSDVARSEITDVLEGDGVDIGIGHGDLPECDLLVYSPAVPEDNPERVVAKERGVLEMSYPELLGEISKVRPTIAVTGMHGKSTTTAMLGLIFVEAGLDPLVVVGSQVPQFGGTNLRVGDGPFIVEACEYRGHMNDLSPKVVAITNIEEEHLDFYRDIDHILQVFGDFVEKIPDDGVLVRVDRDAALHPLMSGGKEVQCDAALIDVMGVNLAVPGDHNRENAAVAATVAREGGIDDEIIKRGLESYRGIWRRFEVVGAYDDVEVVSDYGHHPTEIAATLEAVREHYPGKRVLLVFQPHQYDRTKKLFDNFVEVLREWDGIVISDVYDVAGREEVRDVGSEQLYEKLKGENVWYGGNLDETEKIVRQLTGKFDVFVVMGAGTVDLIARNLIKS